MKKIYISAPITGREDTADERFGNAYKLLKEQGYIPINPWQENRNFCKRGDAIRGGLRLLSRCDGILLCDGWQHSDGCKMEQLYAKIENLEVLFEETLKTE